MSKKRIDMKKKNEQEERNLSIIQEENSVTTTLKEPLMFATNEFRQSLNAEQEDYIKKSDDFLEKSTWISKKRKLNKVVNKSITSSQLESDVDEIRISGELEESTSKKEKIIKGLISGAVGVSSGFAMAPIYNKLAYNLDTLGVDLQASDVSILINTLHTIIFQGFISTSIVYTYLKDKDFCLRDLEQQAPLKKWQDMTVKAGKFVSIPNAALFFNLLMLIELHNQSVEGSSGLDKYIGYGLGTGAGLLLTQLVDINKRFKQAIKKSDYMLIDLDTLGAKLACYGTTALAAIGKYIVYSGVSKDISQEMFGFDETTSNILSGIFGLLATAQQSVLEYSALQGLFSKVNHQFNIKDIAKGLFSSIESMWYSLPLVISGVKYSEDWDDLIKGAVFTALFLSSTNYYGQKFFSDISFEGIPKEKGRDIGKINIHFSDNNSMHSSNDSEYIENELSGKTLINQDQI